MVVVTSAMRPLDWFTKGRVRTFSLEEIWWLSFGCPWGLRALLGLSSVDWFPAVAFAFS